MPFFLAAGGFIVPVRLTVSDRLSLLWSTDFWLFKVDFFPLRSLPTMVAFLTSLLLFAPLAPVNGLKSPRSSSAPSPKNYVAAAVSFFLLPGVTAYPFLSVGMSEELVFRRISFLFRSDIALLRLSP